jgi:ABC-type proline/glycine betaine transport system permease subunit
MLEKTVTLAIHLSVTISLIGCGHLISEGHIADAFKYAIAGSICVFTLASAEFLANKMRNKQ